jgi:hypothetical protein
VITAVEGRDATRRRVVDQTVESIMASGDRVDERGEPVLGSEICRCGATAVGTDCIDRLRQLSLVAGHDLDVRAARRQPFGEDPADAARAAGDQDRAVV